MKFLKLFVVLFIGLVAAIGLTLGWIYRMGVKATNVGTDHVAVDLLYVATRPLYLLEMAVIVALAVWLCRRWVFAG
jgi:hypothetical protein